MCIRDRLGRAQEILRGTPNDVALPLAYWRHRSSPEDMAKPLDPARDGCGLIWYSPLVPMTRRDVERFVATTTSTCLEFDIDPLITLTSVSPRCFDCTIPLLFDAEQAGAADRARACYRALFDRNAAEGYVPYRLPVTEMERVVDARHAYWDVVRTIKAALDPHGIVSPGRYAPQGDGVPCSTDLAA